MKGLEEYFKGLADINRLRIINLLLNGELCGCDLQYVIDASQSNISRHLTYLKRSGLVQDRREGYRVYYRLMKNSSAEFKGLVSYLEMALKGKLFLADRKKLREAIKNGVCSVSEFKGAAISQNSRRTLSAR